MKIIQINCVYAIGSTGKIVEDISNYCISKGDDVFVLYGRQGKNITSNIMKVSSELEAKIHSVKSRLTGLDFSYSTIATKRTLNFIKSYKPDVVHLHCLNGHFINVYKLLRFLKQEKIPTILTLHAEIMHTAGCEHAYDCMKWVEGCYGCDKIKGYLTRIYRDDSKLAYSKMKESFDGFENIAIVSVSKWLENRAKQSAIFRHCHAKFITIENGLDLQSFVPLNINPLKEKFDGKNPIILHVTPNFNHPLKGGKYVIELAQKHPEWSFIIVGYNGDITLPSNVTTVGHTKNKEELSWYYNIADVTLLTSKRETFSMVCAESLACGTPVVGFRAGGPESVFIGDFARFVDYGDVRELGEAINEMITLSPKIDAVLINKKFSAKDMAIKYRQLYKEIIK